MLAPTALRHARRRAHLTQRSLARLSGVPQSTVARIESGAVDPRVATLDRLLRACGEELDARRRLTRGADRTGMRELLALTPAERLDRAEADARGLDELLDALER